MASVDMLDFNLSYCPIDEYEGSWESGRLWISLKDVDSRSTVMFTPNKDLSFLQNHSESIRLKGALPLKQFHILSYPDL